MTAMPEAGALSECSMSDHPDPVSNLKAVRAALVAQRRAVAQSAAATRFLAHADDTDELGSDAGSDIATIQKQIEAVDNAIQDEELIAQRVRSEEIAIRPGFQRQVGPRGDVA